jgi:lipid-binding SYLF domain-containing protein
MKKAVLVISILLIAAIGYSAPKSAEKKDVLHAQVNEAVAAFKAKDADIQRFFDTSYGYAVLPKIFKGALWVGGAHGQGEVYTQGAMVGYTSLTQASIGFSFGGGYFSEIIFFKDKEDLEKFKAKEYAFDAQVTAVAANAGAAAKADYKAGLAVFFMAEKGLMVDASVGGQKFTYESLSVEGK